MGNTKSSRIKISLVGLVFSVAVMLLPVGLSLWIGERQAVFFSFIAWVGLFLLVNFLVLLISQLVKIEAAGKTSGKLLGVEMPFELKGMTVVLLATYVLLVFFYLASDLEGQLSAKSQNLRLQERIQELRETTERLNGIVQAFNAIYTGEHASEIHMLKLSYHCGRGEIDERIDDWQRVDLERSRTTNLLLKSSDRPLPVYRTDYSFRVKYGSDPGLDFNGSPLRVNARLDEQGVLTAEIHMEHPDEYEILWDYCREGESRDRYDAALPPGGVEPSKSNPSGG